MAESAEAGAAAGTRRARAQPTPLDGAGERRSPAAPVSTDRAGVPADSASNRRRPATAALHGARALSRMNAERADASAVVHMGYVSELFSSPRHAELPEDVRAEQLLRIALHYTASVSRDWTPGFRVPPPPFVRRGKQTRVPELNETRAVDAWAATPVSHNSDGSRNSKSAQVQL